MRTYTWAAEVASRSIYLSDTIQRFVCKCKKGQYGCQMKNIGQTYRTIVYFSSTLTGAMISKTQTVHCRDLKKQMQSANWAKKNHLTFTPFLTQDLKQKNNKYKTTRHGIVKQSWTKQNIYAEIIMYCYSNGSSWNTRFLALNQWWI